MAEKTHRLITDALVRAATEPEGVPLWANKSEPGLFPSTAAARAAADRCIQDGYLRVLRCESKGNRSREFCVLTEQGRQYLARQVNPRHVLEDLIRVLESRQDELSRMAEAVSRMQQGTESIRSTVQQVIPRLEEEKPLSVHRNGTSGAHPASPPAQPNGLDQLFADIKTKLAEWHAAAGASQDCPLPDLFRRLESVPSIGQFHDCLRQLHEDDQIYLHPWTGPLYAMPEPAYALLSGHEIAYYASIR